VRKEVERDGILRAIEIEGADLQPLRRHAREEHGPDRSRTRAPLQQSPAGLACEFVCGPRGAPSRAMIFTCAFRLPKNWLAAGRRCLRCIARSGGTRRELQDGSRAATTPCRSRSRGCFTGYAAWSAGCAHPLPCVEGIPADYLGFFGTAFAKSEKTIALLARLEDGQLLFAQDPSAGKDMNGLLKRVLEESRGQGPEGLAISRGAPE